MLTEKDSPMMGAIYLQVNKERQPQSGLFYRKQQKIDACAVTAAFHLVNSKR
jgi:hypothetical protein